MVTGRTGYAWLRLSISPYRDSMTSDMAKARLAVDIGRTFTDLAIEKGWRFDPPAPASGKKVLVVGAGPSGLSAAYHLARLGHTVTIKEAGPMPGGMMRFGIPKYRLPRDVIDAEVKRITDLGVVIAYDAKVDRIDAAMKATPTGATMSAACSAEKPRPTCMNIAWANGIDTIVECIRKATITPPAIDQRAKRRRSTSGLSPPRALPI